MNLGKAKELLGIALRARAKADIFPNNYEKETCKYYRSLNLVQKLDFFKSLTDDFGIDSKLLSQAMTNYQSNPSNHRYELDLRFVVKVERSALTPSYELFFKNIQQHPNGLKFLIDLRSDLLNLLQNHNSPNLKTLGKSNHVYKKVSFLYIIYPGYIHLIPLKPDSRIKLLLSDWFVMGHLTLNQITWLYPASVLERMIQLEAVHKVDSWDHLKQRFGLYRYSFALFHKSIPNEPLAFIYAAVSSSIPNNVQTILNQDTSQPIDNTSDLETIHSTSVKDNNSKSIICFYSITSSQKGLSGIDLGNVLIKQSVDFIKRVNPTINTFVTLSPIPNFSSWLISSLKIAISSNFKNGTLLHSNETPLFGSNDMKSHVSFLEIILDIQSQGKSILESNPHIKYILMRLCSRYLIHEKRKRLALDPVCHFHLRNGAVIYRLNWLANDSKRGIYESFGMMVNYQYILQLIKSNNEAYLVKGHIALSNSKSNLVVDEKYQDITYVEK